MVKMVNHICVFYHHLKKGDLTQMAGRAGETELQGWGSTDPVGWGSNVNAPSIRMFEQRLEACNFRDAKEKIPVAREGSPE